MSRNLTDMNTKIFKYLDDHCDRIEVKLNNAGRHRYIKLRKEDIPFATKFKLKTRYWENFERQVIIFTHEDSTFFCFVGFQYLNDDAKFDKFFEVEHNAGFLTHIWYVTDLRPEANKDKISDVFDIGSDGDKDYEGHDFQVISSILPTITIFKSDDIAHSSYEKCLLRLCLYERLNDHSDFDIELYNVLIDLICKDIPELPYDTIARSVLDGDPASLFLALYRSFEAIYSIQACQKVKNNLGTEHDWQEISKALEHELKWRPNELDSLKYLFNAGNTENLNGVIDAIDGGTVGGNRVQSASKRVYDLRNKLVHYRPAIKLTDELVNINWKKLYLNLIGLLIDAYNLLPITKPSKSLPAQRE